MNANSRSAIHPLRTAFALLFLAPVLALAQPYTLRGVIADATSGETLIGANVVVKGTTQGTVTDVNGRFSFQVDAPPPYTLVLSFIGYQQQEVQVQDPSKELKFKMSTDQVLLQEAEVVGSRIGDKQKMAPMTVESMDVIAIREAPSGDFYESLGNLKGVDMTTASMGFKVINTRGFNSTSPVRSLQLIDGVDNQSPGLNFSLGNFLGASDLDVMRVDIIAGASSAYYGPGAFNGVINMTTKSPWLFPGLSVSVKGGERSMLEGAVRYAQVLKDKDGKDRWAYKINGFGMRAEDWFAENYDATSNSPTTVTNPGRYDAVNIYGDEDVTVNNNYLGSTTERRDYPGLGEFLRPGYRERDLVDYSTHNLKLGGSLHYLLTDGDSLRSPVEAILASNFSTGSTVYQGDNRYRLQGVKFFQHRVEVREEGKWFVRGYLTHEDAGTTYDIFTTAVRLQQASGNTQDWNIPYANLWQSWIKPQVEADPDYITVSEAIGLGWDAATWNAWQAQYIADNNDLFSNYHQLVADSVNLLNTTTLDPAYAVGTARFDDKFNEITGKRFTEGGSLFYDRSALAHAMGEYRFTPEFGEVVVGGNFRQYMPNTAGTIFRDTGNVVIRNQEFGVYAGLEKMLMDDRLKVTLTMRMDKNQNFNALFSPAASLVYSETGVHIWRMSFSGAIRNPTLADQYLYYNVGRALLLGNVDGQFEAGRDSMFTLESFDEYRSSPSLLQGLSKLDYFNVDRIRPEQVRTIEAGYRGTLSEKVYVDVSAYNSWYEDFIGYVIGLYGKFNPQNGFPVGGLQAFRLAANATAQVTTRGANVGVSYYRKKMTYSVNYSYNKLVSGADDPIIPAFNTPENKFNVGFTGHDMKDFLGRPNLGFGINYKWVQGFTFTGSPQFSGPIPTYDIVDAQVNVRFPSVHTTVKLGASNLLGISPLFTDDGSGRSGWDRMWNNDVYLVYGGPRVGRLAYIQLIYEFDKR